MATIINSCGLVANIIGSLLLLKFGLPPKIDPEGHTHITTSQVDESEIAIGRIYKRWSRLAIILLIIGFGLQLISNFVK